jgi:hypothetical protein
MITLSFVVDEDFASSVVPVLVGFSLVPVVGKDEATAVEALVGADETTAVEAVVGATVLACARGGRSRRLGLPGSSAGGYADCAAGKDKSRHQDGDDGKRRDEQSEFLHAPSPF